MSTMGSDEGGLRGVESVQLAVGRDREPIRDRIGLACAALGGQHGSHPEQTAARRIDLVHLRVVGDVGLRQLGGQGDPHSGDCADQVQLPAIDPAVPAGLGPVGFRVNGGVRDLPLFPVFLVPDAAVRPQYGAIDRRPPGVLPGCQSSDQPHGPVLAGMDETLERQGARIFFGHDPDFWRSVPQAPNLVV